MPVAMSKLEKKFWDFHGRHPEVYDGLCLFANEWKDRRPKDKLAIAMLYEKMRWDFAMGYKGKRLRMSNSYRSYYARLIMSEQVRLNGLFDIRPQTHQATFGPTTKKCSPSCTRCAPAS